MGLDAGQGVSGYYRTFQLAWNVVLCWLQVHRPKLLAHMRATCGRPDARFASARVRPRCRPLLQYLPKACVWRLAVWTRTRLDAVVS